MEGDRPDVLSFDVRARALDAAAATLARWKTPPEDVARHAAGARDGAARAVRRVGEIAARERAAIFRARAAICSARSRPRGAHPNLKDAGERDDWLARRIAEVTKSLAPKSLTADERDELDDALDPLERLLEASRKSRAALVELRLAVQRVRSRGENRAIGGTSSRRALAARHGDDAVVARRSSRSSGRRRRRSATRSTSSSA